MVVFGWSWPLLPRVLMALGSIPCIMSIKMTLHHAYAPSFEAPNYKKGRKHPRYHAFRGATLAIGAVLALNMVANAPMADRTPTLWNVAAIVSAGYFGGWWIPNILGLTTPNWTAEANHILAASCCCA